MKADEKETRGKSPKRLDFMGKIA